MSFADTILEAVEALDVPWEERLDLINEARAVLANAALETPSEDAKEGETFYRTVLTVEVLSEDEISLHGWSLADIEREFTDGHFSGTVNVDAFQKVSAEDMEVLLMKQGTVPEFFGLGADRDDEDAEF